MRNGKINREIISTIPLAQPPFFLIMIKFMRKFLIILRDESKFILSLQKLLRYVSKFHSQKFSLIQAGTNVPHGG